MARAHLCCTLHTTTDVVTLHMTTDVITLHMTTDVITLQLASGDQNCTQQSNTTQLQVTQWCRLQSALKVFAACCNARCCCTIAVRLVHMALTCIAWGCQEHDARADAPSPGRACALAGMSFMPATIKACTTGLSRLDLNSKTMPRTQGGLPVDLLSGQ